MNSLGQADEVDCENSNSMLSVREVPFSKSFSKQTKCPVLWIMPSVITAFNCSHLYTSVLIIHALSFFST